jgi:hypothetical protein
VPLAVFVHGVFGRPSNARGEPQPGTSPLATRLIAVVSPSLNWTSAADTAAIAVRALPFDVDCLASIAMLLPARSDTDLISGRAMATATRWSVSFSDAVAVFSVSIFFALRSGAGITVAGVACAATAAAALKFATLAVGSAAILDAASYAFGD